MSRKDPDKREQARAYKLEQAEQGRRWSAALMAIEGAPYREIAEAVGRSLYLVRYWVGRLPAQAGWRVVGGRRKKRLAFRKGARRLAATGKRGPPKGGRSARREAAREGILALKRERPELGAAKICAMAGSPVSAPTALAIIREEFPAPPGKAARKATGSFCMGRPNELWQIDYVDLGSGMHLLSVPDGCSRKILSCDVRRTSTTDDVLEILEAAISRHGAPERILSDHGTQWYSTVGGRCRFDEWCGSRGIGHSMGRIGKPTTQGKVERWHGSLRRECRLPPAGSGAEEFSEAVGAYVAFYNSERPHWSLGLRTPDSAYYGA